MSVYTPIGYTFENYVVPPGEWGDPITVDDLRHTYLFGIELTSTTGVAVTDVQLRQMIRFALSRLEHELSIDLRKRIRKSQVTIDASTTPLVKAKYWKTGVDYTDLEDPYMFDGDTWSTGYGFCQLRHRPVISVDAALLRSAVDTTIINLVTDKWIRLEGAEGQVFAYPKWGSGSLAAGPFLGGFGEVISRYRGSYPQGMTFDYTSGYATSDDIPDVLREAVALLASIGTLGWVAGGMLPGVSSSSISLDGLSESQGSTQSSSSTYFGPRIKELQDAWKEWRKVNRYKLGPLPIAFI